MANKKYSEVIGKLKAKIKAQTTKGIAWKKIIRGLSGEDKHEEKLLYCSEHRVKARHTLLAYAFLRGLPYKAVERKCEVSPNPFLISEIINDILGTKTEKRMLVFKTEKPHEDSTNYLMLRDWIDTEKKEAA